MRKLIMGCLIGILLVSLVTGCGSSTGTTQSSAGTSGKSGDSGKQADQKMYTLRLSIVGPEDHASAVAIFELQDELEADSDGRLKLEFFHSGQLYGSERETIEAVQLGNIEMTVSTTAAMSSFDQRFMIFDLPFLYDSREKARQAVDGELGRILQDGLPDIGLVGLGFMENGFRHIFNNKGPIEKPEDLQGLKIRTMESSLYVDTFNTLGAMASPLAFGELYSALQQGTYDGMENPVDLFENMKFYEVQKYLTLSGQVYSPVITIINKDVYDSMPADLQEILVKWADKLNQRERQIIYDGEQAVLERLAEKVEITELTPEQLQEFKDKVAPIYDQYTEVFGEELMSAVQASR